MLASASTASALLDKSTLGDFSGPSLERMVSRDVFLAETQQACGVVIENVSFLLLRQERRLLDRFNRFADLLRPAHLIRSEHPPLPQTRPNQCLQVVVESRAWEQAADGHT